MPNPVDAFLKTVPADRKAALSAVREAIAAKLPKGYVESVQGGMLVYEVPLAVYPDTYNKKPLMYAALGNQKGYMALYLCGLYASEALTEKFRARFAKAGKKLDMGKSCVRFKRLEDLDLGAVKEAVGGLPMKKFIDIAKAAHSDEAKAARREARAPKKPA